MPAPQPSASEHSLPYLPVALLRALVPRAERDEVLADIADEYAHRAGTRGEATARR